MNEAKYYRNQQDCQENPEDEYPEYDMELDKNDARGRKNEKEQIKAPVFVSSRSPSLKDCDVMRPIKKPTVEDKINKIMDGTYMSKNRDKKPLDIASKKSIDSYPIRLAGSNGSETSEELRPETEFDTPQEVEQLYNSLTKNAKTTSQFPKVTTVSQNSKHTNPQDSKKETQKDWILTPLYEEFEKYGQQRFNYENDPELYTEDEIKNVDEFIKNRYNQSREYDKTVSNFYNKAMNTLE